MTIRVTAISHDCGDRFPHTLDWMARSFYLANPAVERLLDEEAFAVQREDDPDVGDEDLLCWGIEEPDDRLVARVIESMSIAHDDDDAAREEDDGLVGAHATYIVRFARAAFVDALEIDAEWESPCFDLARPTWRLRRVDEWSLVACDGDQWGHATMDEAAALRGGFIETAEEGGYGGAAAFVDDAIRGGWTLVWCNHVGDPSTWCA